MAEHERICCYIADAAEACDAPSEWIVVSGLSPDDYTEACSAHVGYLLTDVEETRVYRVE